MISSNDFLPTPKSLIVCKANLRSRRHSSPFPQTIPEIHESAFHSGCRYRILDDRSPTAVTKRSINQLITKNPGKNVSALFVLLYEDRL